LEKKEEKRRKKEGKNLLKETGKYLYKLKIENLEFPHFCKETSKYFYTIRINRDGHWLCFGGTMSYNY
jgi:hypothetical protein